MFNSNGGDGQPVHENASAIAKSTRRSKGGLRLSLGMLASIVVGVVALRALEAADKPSTSSHTVNVGDELELVFNKPALIGDDVASLRVAAEQLEQQARLLASRLRATATTEHAGPAKPDVDRLRVAIAEAHDARMSAYEAQLKQLSARVRRLEIALKQRQAAKSKTVEENVLELLQERAKQTLPPTMPRVDLVPSTGTAPLVPPIQAVRPPANVPTPPVPNPAPMVEASSIAPTDVISPVDVQKNREPATRSDLIVSSLLATRPGGNAAETLRSAEDFHRMAMDRRRKLDQVVVRLVEMEKWAPAELIRRAEKLYDLDRIAAEFVRAYREYMAQMQLIEIGVQSTEENLSLVEAQHAQAEKQFSAGVIPSGELQEIRSRRLQAKFALARQQVVRTIYRDVLASFGKDPLSWEKPRPLGSLPKDGRDELWNRHGIAVDEVLGSALPTALLDRETGEKGPASGLRLCWVPVPDPMTEFALSSTANGEVQIPAFLTAVNGRPVTTRRELLVALDTAPGGISRLTTFENNAGDRQSILAKGRLRAANRTPQPAKKRAIGSGVPPKSDERSVKVERQKS